jgi:hypothetical protein
VAPPCKLRLFRFSNKLRCQDRAECGKKYPNAEYKSYTDCDDALSNINPVWAPNLVSSDQAKQAFIADDFSNVRIQMNKTILFFLLFATSALIRSETYLLRT